MDLTAIRMRSVVNLIVVVVVQSPKLLLLLMVIVLLLLLLVSAEIRCVLIRLTDELLLLSGESSNIRSNGIASHQARRLVFMFNVLMTRAAATVPMGSGH